MSSLAEHRVVIVCDHPSLHRGFSTVGERIAHHLHAELDLSVTYIGRYPPDSGWRSPGYAVRDLHGENGFTEVDGRDPSLGRHLRECVDIPRGGQVTVLCIGTWNDLAVTCNELRDSGMREAVRLVGYLPVDYAPIPVQFAEFARGYDRLVPYTRFALETLRDCCRRARLDGVALHEPIAHGVDSTVFHPRTTEARAAARARCFGIGDDELLIGYFGRNSTHKRPDLVLRLFQLFATGAYGVCRRCGATSADPLNLDGTPGSPVVRCAACDSTELDRGDACDHARLYLHTDLHADPEVRRTPNARDLVRIAARYGIESRVQFTPDISIGRGVPAAELADRMAACDIHVLPFICAGFELTVLETGACGVPNIITDFASPPDYAAPFSRLIPVGSPLLEDEVRGVVDIDQALRALVHLAGAPEERRALGVAGVQTARELDWQRIAGQWVALLRDVAHDRL